MIEKEHPLYPLDKTELALEALVKANEEVIGFKSEDPQAALRLGYTLVVRRFQRMFELHESRKAIVRQGVKGKFSDEEEAVSQLLELDDTNRIINENKSLILDAIQTAQEGDYQPLREYLATNGVTHISNDLKIGQGMLRIAALIPLSGEPLEPIAPLWTQPS